MALVPPPERRHRLAHTLAERSLDALLVTHPVNVTYLTGFTGESSPLIVGRTSSVLLSDGRFTQQIAEECPGLDAVIRRHDQLPTDALAALLQARGENKIGVESTHLTLYQGEQLREKLPSFTLVPSAGLVEELRTIKDDGEVAAIRKAVACAERAYFAVRALLRGVDSERDVSDSVEFALRRAGARGSCFPPIAAGGPRSALPHAVSGDAPIGATGWLLLDWGATAPLYKSDMTRILVTAGAHFHSGPTILDPKLEIVYNTVLAAQQAAIRAIRPGAIAKDVDAAARQVIANAGYGEAFSHGLGHGLGLEVHEAPSLRATSDTVLQPGMVMTVEPGVYLPNWGGVRIEDDILVTPDGCELLSTLPRDWASCHLT